MNLLKDPRQTTEMDSATPTTNPHPNPNLKNPKNVYHIGGIRVEFPYQPYGSQLAFMGRVISTLDRAQRDGHCHALLESPTGTGKSLSLLCSALAWQQNRRSKNLYANLSFSKPAPEALSDPLAYGGGFVPETEPSSISAAENLEPSPSAPNSKNQKKKITPTIFYASMVNILEKYRELLQKLECGSDIHTLYAPLIGSDVHICCVDRKKKRTHSQISQVIREYRKTTYRVPMAVLASRKHYCTNTNLRGKENLDEECKLLLKNRDVGCLEFKNAHKVKGHPSLQKGGCHEAHDIEDLVKVGQVVKGCSYYAARSMADDAQLVFCPYSYIINPVIRGAMEVDIKGAIVILDEAHNIEDIARDAGSVDIEEDVWDKLQTELQQLCQADALIYQPLYEMTQDIMSWIHRRKSTLEKSEFQHYFSCWTGDKALRELQEASISIQCFPILLECATKAIKAATDTESEAPHLSGMSVITLEGLFSSLTYFFSGNGVHIFDYQLALQRYVKRDAGSATGSWTHTFSLWCLNPAVVFRDIANLSLSVILTSGTLSPMNSFSSELGVQFGTCLEAPHVIDVESQLWAAAISTGPGNYPLNASYKTADGYAFQDALGNSLEEICKIVPCGALVFFPSYKLMEKLCSRWRETGQWSRLNAHKSLFVEPRAGSQDDFETVLKGYYDSNRQGNKPSIGRKRRGKKTDPNHFYATESQESSKKEGAAFLAVCRGKVSEGIDFSDEDARVVIIVGIPFPNIHDIQIAQKKKYNDMYKSSKNLLSGNEWYCHQAFRALNQAAGRCIRHRFDYGAIILLDERFQEERNIAYISKWLRKSIRQYDNFDTSLEGIKSFFSDVKERFGKKTVSFSQNSVIHVENILLTDQSKGFTRKKNQKLNKSDHCREKVVSKNTENTTRLSGCLTYTTKNDANFPKLKSQGNVELLSSVIMDEKDSSSCKEYIDLECSPHKDLRCSHAISMTSSYDKPKVSIMKETPGMEGDTTIASPVSCKDENSSSTITEFPDQLESSSGAPSKATCLMAVTPERNVTGNTYSLVPEIESSLSLSVNSHTQKRRKSMGSPLVNLIQAEWSDALDPRTPGHISFMESSMATRDANRKIEFDIQTNCSEQKFTKSNLPQLLPANNRVTSSILSGPVMDKKLQIFCSKCTSPLGLPENHLYVTCSLTSSSKVHLASLLKGRLEPPAADTSTRIPVVMSDISSVNQRLCDRSFGGALGQGIWCEKDGCVFNTIFCPFCSTPNNCLGVQIMATDASNVQLLNKILFYFDCLEIKSLEASENKDLSPVSHKDHSGISALKSFGKFSYKPPQNSGGWRTTKSKLRLPK